MTTPKLDISGKLDIQLRIKADKKLGLLTTVQFTARLNPGDIAALAQLQKNDHATRVIIESLQAPLTGLPGMEAPQ